MADNDRTAGTASNNSSLPTHLESVPGEVPGVMAIGNRKTCHPYAQVALTYIRWPFSSPGGWLISVGFVFLLIAFLLFGRVGNHQETNLFVLFLFLICCLAVHVKGQFADSRAHLIPGFRRVHATVAAVATLIFVVILPGMLTYFLGWNSIGFVAVLVLMLGITIWGMVKDAVWTMADFALLAGFWAICFTESGRACFRELISGQFEPYAAALLCLGTLITVLAGIRLVRLNEDMPAYGTNSQRARQAWSDMGRSLPGPEDWINERRLARLTRHARCASASWWSGVSRWQVGMSTGRSAFLMVFFACVFLPNLTSGQNLRNVGAVVAMTMLSFTTSCMAWGSFLRRRAPMLARGLLLPVDRRTFVRQVGTAAAIDQLQFWAGMGAGIALWVWLAGPKAASVTDFAVLLGVFTLFQFWFFGLGAWFSRYRNFGMLWGGYFLGFQLLLLAGGLFGGNVPLIPWKYMELWLAGIIAIFGLLLTYDAFRRWLVTDFE